MNEVRTIASFDELPVTREEVRIGQRIVTVVPDPSSASRAWRVLWPQGYTALMTDAGFSGSQRVVDFSFNSNSGQVGTGSMLEFDELAHAWFGGPMPER